MKTSRSDKCVVYFQALQSEALKLEQFQEKLLQRNSDLQQKLRNMDIIEFESSCVALSPSTDTGMISYFMLRFFMSGCTSHACCNFKFFK